MAYPVGGAKQIEGATRNWWMLLVSGGLWIVFSLAILQFDLSSVWSIAVLTGIVLWLAASTELWIASVTPTWRVGHVLIGLLFLIGGITAFAWPGSTFVVLARLIGWYLLFLGTFQVVESFAARRTEFWWLRLISGMATIAIAFWAAGSLDRSATVLVLWVGLGALLRGIDQVFLAFEFRHVHETLRYPTVTQGRSSEHQNASESRPVAPF